MVVTEDKSCSEFFNQFDTRCKRSVESGCMACETSTGIGSSLGLQSVTIGTTFGVAQLGSMLSVNSSNSHCVILVRLCKVMGQSLYGFLMITLELGVGLVELFERLVLLGLVGIPELLHGRSATMTPCGVDTEAHEQVEDEHPSDNQSDNDSVTHTEPLLHSFSGTLLMRLLTQPTVYSDSLVRLM